MLYDSDDRPALRDIDFLIGPMDYENRHRDRNRNRWLATLGRYGNRACAPSSSFHEDLINRTDHEVEWDEQLWREYVEMREDDE